MAEAAKPAAPTNAKSSLYSMNREEPIDIFSALNGFTKDSLFMYSLENADVVYENDIYAQKFIEHYLAHEFITTAGELRDWYQGFFKMREKAISEEAEGSSQGKMDDLLDLNRL